MLAPCPARLAALPRRAASFLRTDRGVSVTLYCACFAGLGLCLSTLGPVLLDLAVRTGSTLQYTGYCFGVRSAGYALGSTAGPAYDRLPGHLVLGSAMLLACVGSLLIPLARSVYTLGLAVALQGIGMGLCDTGGNVMTIWLYGSDPGGGPAMQSLHFAFAVGATAGPLLLRLVEVPVVDPDTGAPLLGKGSYDRAFYIIAAVCAAIGVALYTRPSPQPRASQCVLLLSVMLFLYVGAETGYGAYLTAYSVLALGTSEAEGQVLTGGYWAAIMLGRFASIFTSSMVQPGPLLGLAMAGSAASSLLLLLFARAGTAAVWPLTLAFGASMACIFPTAMSLAETFFPVQGVHATAFVVGAASGEMLIPFIIATLFGGGQGEGAGTTTSPLVVGPSIMLWMVAASCIGQFIAYHFVMANGLKLQGRIAAARARL